MKISAVILSYNSAETIGKCLDSLIEALGSDMEVDSEIFIVDNGSNEQCLDVIDAYSSRYPGVVKPIYLGENTGTTFSRNCALKQCVGDYILVLDSDAYINAEALALLEKYLLEDVATGIAVPRLFYESGNFQLSCDRFPTLFHKLRRFFLLKSMEKQSSDLLSAMAPVAVDYAISACWLIRRDAFEAVGLFDENIFYSPEDVDYCLRVWESGYRVTYVPTAGVVHAAQELSRGLRLSKFHFSHLKGLLYLLKKHRYFWSRKALYARLGRDAP